LRRLILSLFSLGLAVAAASAASTTASTPLSPKLRADLAALVSGEATLDERIPSLIPGLAAGEIPYFAVLAEPNDALHRAQLEGVGARVLNTYRSVDAFALASDPATVSEVAALSWVDWLAPVEVVETLSHETELDEARNTPTDVGASPSWDNGVTGDGVRVAVLDTGVEPTHQDLDDLDFRHWTPAAGNSPLVSPPKVVDSRDFNGSSESPVCPQSTVVTDGNGHGTHVAGIALGTGEGIPLDPSDDGKHAGVAPGAELAVGKALTDAGAGVNSDLLAALEWAAMPEDASPLGCSIGADIVNLSIGSEARPDRLNSGEDKDLVSLTLNRLAAKYGTLFVGAIGNSGPYMGSSLEAPGSAAQVLSVGAGPKDYDLNHDDTLSGDTCAGWTHDDPPAQPAPFADFCGANPSPLHPPSLAGFSSRGTGATWLRPDIVGPGYYIVSAQASTGVTLAAIDTNPNTQGANDLLYATASGTSMATPAVAGSAALVLEAYRDRYGGADPSGASGLPGFQAPTHALLKAAVMNTAGSNLYEARSIVTVKTPFGLQSVRVDPRNGPGDPYVGPLAEGAGKVNVARAIAALRDGVVIYSGASGSAEDRGTGPRDFQGSWQVGAIQAGQSQSQAFVLHSAPGGPATASATFSFQPGNPSDGSRAIAAGKMAGSWSVRLPGKTTLRRGRDELARFTVVAPKTAVPGSYTGAVVVSVSNGQTLRIPVHATVALHDPSYAAGNAPGPQAFVISARDVYGRDSTTWPSAAGAALGAQADWLVFPVELGTGLTSATFTVYDSADGDETYDLYLYEADLDLEKSTHPFVPGTTTTDPVANDQRGASTQTQPQVLTVANPAAGRHYLVVNRAKPGLSAGDFGSFVLALDEVAR
jgi:subtilisin family serine protease